MQAHADLIRDIDATVTAPGQVALWWLGQHGFVVKGGGTVVYLDPFLTPLEGRLVPPLLRPEEVTNAAAVCGSHDHADHIDRPAWPAMAQASPRARFVLPAAVRDAVLGDLGLPADRVVGLDAGAVARLDAAAIMAVPAAHEFLDCDPATGRFPYLGFVVRLNGFTLYHAGDSCLYEGIHDWLRRWPPDAMLVPINGRDAQRLAAGCIGNMTYQEAADLAGALRPRLVIPTHYDMFAGNLGDPAAFAAYVRVKYPNLAVHVCGYGERVMCDSNSHYGRPPAALCGRSRRLA